MARWEPNCTITRNFAFGGKQYKRGKKAYLSGEVKEFAALKRCAVMITPEVPVVNQRVIPSRATIEGSNV